MPLIILACAIVFCVLLAVRADLKQRGDGKQKTMFDDAADVKITSDGFLVARPRVARAGVELCSYPQYGYDQLRVYRPADELFRPATLASLAWQANHV